MQLHVGQRIGIVVNGEATETGAATLAELVAELGYNEGQVATALNGDFVPRAARRDRRETTASSPRGRLGIEHPCAPRQGGSGQVWRMQDVDGDSDER